ncbi:hypothetical protein [Desulforegula conservatrix]|uniref:hypothetical protein n=1 Tax=Desulforegula conservatrix TaxID=153026 RepID=UPI00041F1586|nr:hypothetical protein [Desulforegula conservatrix]
MGKPEIETTNLDIIIEKIRSDGIEAAEKEGLRIKDEARADADNIIKRAKIAAEILKADAEKEIAHKENISRKALEFAVRDSILMIRSYLENLFKNLVRKKCAEVLCENLLKDMILKVTDKWSESATWEDIKIQISDEDSNRIKEVLYSAISEEIKSGKVVSGLEIIPIPDLKAGFRISKKGENFYHDFSDESIAEILMFFLSSEIKELLDPV